MQYLKNLSKEIEKLDHQKVKLLEKLILKTHQKGGDIYVCGNGGSAANAEHITNDLSLGRGKKKTGLRFRSLCSNFSQISCIANDISYDMVFSHQLNMFAKKKKDMLVVLSGSGNSKNILNAIQSAKKNKLEVFGIYGFNGGKAKKLTKNHIHININDMQISEDMQLIIFNFIMKRIFKMN